jgi:molecular chaperone GrpE
LSDRHKEKPENTGNRVDNVKTVPHPEVEEDLRNGGETGEEKVSIPASEYKELLEQAEELKDRYLRVAADFDNYRKRMEKEKEEIVCYANEKLVSDLLPILDNLERALAADPEGINVEGILEGIHMVSRQLHSVLTGCGLEPVHALGNTFDPMLHEAVGVLPSVEHDEGTVLAELQKGYKLKGKVLRHSMVHVAGQPGGDSGESER